MKVEVTAPRDNRPRTTLNLANIGKVVRTTEEKPVVAAERVPDRPIDPELLKKAWEEFSALRKNQVAEYTILNRGYTLQGVNVVVPLTNPIEEPMLHTMRTSLITFLRDKLGNSSLMVRGELQETTGQAKVIYTNKEKFEHLAQLNPLLLDLKERLGLDPEL